jgi:hypothetical protein
MKELIHSLPLILFLVLLLILSFSLYFGDVRINESMATTTPKRTKPKRTTPKRTTPKRTTPKRTTPKRTTPKRTTPKRTTVPITKNPKDQLSADINTIFTYVNNKQLNKGLNTEQINKGLYTEQINKGLDNKDKGPGYSYSDSDSDSDSDDDDNKSKSKSNDEEWFAYWHNVANSSDPNRFSSSNLVPKTQIVPGSCPNCQTGHGNGVCTSCGGLGGSGTTSKYKNRFSDFLSTYGSGYKGQGNWAGYGGSGSGSGSSSELGRLVAGAGSGALDLTKTALNEATDLASGAGSGALRLAENTGSGGVGLLRDTGSGATGLLRDAGSGATGLLRDAGSGAAGLLKTNPAQLGNTPYGQKNGGGQGGPNGYNAGYNNPYQSGYYSQGTYNLPNNPLGVQGIDPYSYNGALVSKGSNYIPVTGDFSSFRK